MIIVLSILSIRGQTDVDRSSEATLKSAGCWLRKTTIQVRTSHQALQRYAQAVSMPVSSASARPSLTGTHQKVTICPWAGRYAGRGMTFIPRCQIGELHAF